MRVLQLIPGDAKASASNAQADVHLHSEPREATLIKLGFLPLSLGPNHVLRSPRSERVGCCVTSRLHSLLGRRLPWGPDGSVVGVIACGC